MAKKKEEVGYRGFRIDGIDKEFKITKATAIKADIDAILHVDRLPDGSVRIIYNGKVIEDLTQVPGFTIVRKDTQDGPL